MQTREEGGAVEQVGHDNCVNERGKGAIEREIMSCRRSCEGEIESE